MIEGSIERVDDHTVALHLTQGGALGAGGSLQLSDGDRAPQLPAAVREQPDRHRPLRARRVRRRRQVHPQEEGRRPVLGRRGLSRRDPLPELRRGEPAHGACLRRCRMRSTSSASSSCRWRSRSKARSSRSAPRRRCACKFRVDQEPFNDKQRPAGDRQVARQRRDQGARLPGGRRCRRELPRRADPSGVFRAAAAGARRRGRQGASRGGRQGEPRSHHRHRQHRRPVAPGGRRGHARPGWPRRASPSTST